MPTHAVPTRRSWSRRLALVVVLLLAATSLSFAPSANAATPTFGLGTGFDGTKQGTSQACPITGTGGDNTAHDGVVCSATYTVSAADITHGSISDSAVALGTAPNGDPVASDPSALTVRVESGPGLAKTGTPLFTEAGYGVGLLVLGALFLAAGVRRRHS